MTGFEQSGRGMSTQGLDVFSQGEFATLINSAYDRARSGLGRTSWVPATLSAKLRGPVEAQPASVMRLVYGLFSGPARRIATITPLSAMDQVPRDSKHDSVQRHLSALLYSPPVSHPVCANRR